MEPESSTVAAIPPTTMRMGNHDRKGLRPARQDAKRRNSDMLFEPRMLGKISSVRYLSGNVSSDVAWMNRGTDFRYVRPAKAKTFRTEPPGESVLNRPSVFCTRMIVKYRNMKRVTTAIFRS